MNVNRVAETTNMGESNGRNLRPVLPVLFLKKLMKIAEYEYFVQTAGVRGHGVLILCMDGKC
jgi:hypothetical protein